MFKDDHFSYMPGRFMFATLAVLIFTSCSVQKKLGNQLQQKLLSNSALVNAHVGVAVYDVNENKFLLKHNSDKYFVPASNTKLPTLYAGMKYLGDSLTGIWYAERNDTVFLKPAGDPTFLHPDYKQQPVADFLRNQKNKLVIADNLFKSEALGYGWAWDDYLGYYMAERSPLPVYGNVLKWIQQRSVEQKETGNDTAVLVFTDPEINWDVKFETAGSKQFSVTRPRTENVYKITEGLEMNRELEIPFVTNGLQSALELLKDTIHQEIIPAGFKTASLKFYPVHSQPVDSMFKPMMYRSDNFFAEQTLQMVSNRFFGFMDEQKLIDSLLKSDFKEMPQQPAWVDGSGLSRYNLFSPEDFVWLLNKMKNEFGLDRMKTILPTGNTGTLRNYYMDENGLIFAKTGTLSGQVALSGFLITAKNKLLVFSVLVNNHNSSATAVRRAVEQFVKGLRNM